MNDLKDMIPADFGDASKVWIYQCSRPFIDKEAREVNEQLHQFYVQWKAHGEPVKGWAGLLYNQFIVVMADETGTNVSGCSIDGMVRVIKSLERQYSVSFFDRMTLTFLINGKAQMLPFGQVQYAIDKGYINQDTLIFNNVAITKKELLQSWIVRAAESWIAGKVSFTVPSGSGGSNN